MEIVREILSYLTINEAARKHHKCWSHRGGWRGAQQDISNKCPIGMHQALRQMTSTYQADEVEDYGQRNKCPRNLFQRRVVECNMNHDFHCKSATTKQKHGGRCKVFQTVMLFSSIWKTQNACSSQKRRVQTGLKMNDRSLMNACLLCLIYSSPFP